jgi:hypothetical protein
MLKSNRLLTERAGLISRGATMVPRSGDEEGPRCALLTAGDWRFVFGGDLPRGIGSWMPFRFFINETGSGAVTTSRNRD